MVVPMIEMISNTDVEVAPPLMPGTTMCVTKEVKCGLVISNSGTTSKLMAMNSIMKRSQRLNEPVAVTPKRSRIATGTATYLLTPKYCMEYSTPMNSVMMIKKLRKRIEKIERLPQYRPSRSRMSRP